METKFILLGIVIILMLSPGMMVVIWDEIDAYRKSKKKKHKKTKHSKAASHA